MLPFRNRRSGGIRVSAPVHRLLGRANAARDRQDWPEAATAYRAALRLDPSLAHIWVQLGHAAKEAGQRDDAETAYKEAAKLKPGDADPHLHLGHLFHLAGDHARSGSHYLQAFRADPGLLEASSALHRALARARGRKRTELLDLLRATVGKGTDPEPDAVPHPGGPALVYDVSDLIGYFAHARTPTGIQRVQIQVITEAMARPAPSPAATRLCCFIDGRDAWLEVPRAELAALLRLSADGSDANDPAWVAALHRLHLRLALAEPFAFPPGSTLVNLGASWQLPNYFLFVREARRRFGIRYVPMVHDLISVLMPEHFLPAAVQEVVAWLVGVFTHADGVLAISESTKRDLVAVSRRAGLPLDPDAVAVVPLDADFRTPGLRSLPAKEAGPFVLFVSTVESRKGHATALEAWRLLIDRHGAAKVPTLLCVGRRGWLSAGVYRRLEADKELASRVQMRSGVSDEALAGLYEACDFTIYPSAYEGWGLPVTEALSYGKPVIATRVPSLPEAGGAFATYVEPGSATELAAAVEHLAFDKPRRDALAARIRAEFRPRSWTDLADQVEAELHRLAARPAPPREMPRAVPGAFHPMNRGTARRIWPGLGNGEVFRTGTGWLSPEAEGSPVAPGAAGELSIPLPPGTGPVRVGLLLRGDPDTALDWFVQPRGAPAQTGTLSPGGRGWATFTATPGPLLRLRLGATQAERAENTDPGEDEDAPLVLAGFFVHRAGDTEAMLRLLEAIALDNLHDVDAFRPPPRPVPDWMED